MPKVGTGFITSALAIIPGWVKLRGGRDKSVPTFGALSLGGIQNGVQIFQLVEAQEPAAIVHATADCR